MREFGEFMWRCQWWVRKLGGRMIGSVELFEEAYEHNTCPLAAALFLLELDTEHLQ